MPRKIAVHQMVKVRLIAHWLRAATINEPSPSRRSCELAQEKPKQVFHLCLSLMKIEVFRFTQHEMCVRHVSADRMAAPLSATADVPPASNEHALHRCVEVNGIEVGLAAIRIGHLGIGRQYAFTFCRVFTRMVGPPRTVGV